jgi:formimidoylglutamate deiminase
METLARRVGDTYVLPGLATAHSHAFQRALRGRTQRRAREAGSFWTWRGLMYALVERVDPETLYALSHFAFVELAMAGVTAVGEFHYVHHQPDGAPHADRTLLADTVVRAARDAGLRVSLLRCVYERAGYGRALEPGQRRFVDRDVDDALRDVDTLRARHAGDPCVTIGLAPHSVRALSRPWLEAIAAYARAHALPVHAHVSEQRREVQESLAEHGLRPLALLEALGLVDARFVAVHATHLAAEEARVLGAARAFACVCRSTERDLGDGPGQSAALVRAGARLCTGVDSYANSDPFEEARAIELDERVRAEARQVVGEARLLLEAASGGGYAAIGMTGREHDDRVVLDAHDAALAGGPDDADETVLWGAGPRAVREVYVDGTRIVEGGVHRGFDAARIGYERAVRTLGI